MDERESQMAYKELMKTEIIFKPFPIRGKNIRERLQQVGITHVPTFFIPSKRQKIVGYMAIKNMIEQIEAANERQQRAKYLASREKRQSLDEMSEEEMISDNSLVNQPVNIQEETFSDEAPPPKVKRPLPPKEELEEISGEEEESPPMRKQPSKKEAPPKRRGKRADDSGEEIEI